MIEDEKTGLFFIDPTQVEMIPIDRLKLYKRNAKKHTPEQIEQIVNSIKAFGMNDPIAVWGDENVIVEGHGRFMALRSLGEQGEVPCIRLDHLTDEQRKAYALAHNQLTMNTGWDDELLLPELDELGDFFDMGDFGFDTDDEDEHAPAEIVEDDAPEVDEVESVCKRGQIWQLGTHRLMCGDSTNAEDVARLMNGEKADMVFTDPPYNVASDSKNYASDVSKAMKNLSESEWDKDFDITEPLENLLESIADNATVYICTSHFLASTIWTWMKEWADHSSYCVWCKPNPMPSLSKRHWTWNTELICYATRGKHTFNFPKEGHALSSWTIQKKNGKTGHPTEKPIAVPAMGISHSSKQKDIVLDLFGGSGSTLIACEQLDRRCFMMELDPHYCDVIIKRWENLTGQTAELLEE